MTLFGFSKMYVTLTGIQMATVGSGHSQPLVSARYGGPTVCQRNNQRPGCSDPGVKSVHFNTVHNCEQLTPNNAAPHLCNLDEEPGLTTSPLTVGQSLPASYRCRNIPADAGQINPTATINRHYAAQPRTIYHPGVDTHPTVCRGDGCSGSIVNGPHSLSPQCTVSDDACMSTPASRLRHYCV